MLYYMIYIYFHIPQVVYDDDNDDDNDDGWCFTATFVRTIG